MVNRTTDQGMSVNIPQFVAASIAFAAAEVALAATPYITPVLPGVQVQSILTAGDSVNLKPDGVNPYLMVGVPDGLGGFDNGDGTFTLLMKGAVKCSGSAHSD
jgi:hypothetical protein